MTLYSYNAAICFKKTWFFFFLRKPKTTKNDPIKDKNMSIIQRNTEGRKNKSSTYQIKRRYSVQEAKIASQRRKEELIKCQTKLSTPVNPLLWKINFKKWLFNIEMQTLICISHLCNCSLLSQCLGLMVTLFLAQALSSDLKNL